MKCITPKLQKIHSSEIAESDILKKYTVQELKTLSKKEVFTRLLGIYIVP